jgi:hypothetical protein
MSEPNGPEPRNALVPRGQQAAAWAMPRTLAEAIQVAEIVHRANLFPDVRNPGHALVKILAGAELGFGVIASLVDVHLIEGKPSVGAHLRAAAIRSSGHYDYEVVEHTDAVCAVRFSRRRADGTWHDLGVERITLEEAQAKKWHLTRKGEAKGPWRASPKNMLFARCITNGFRFHCPDLTSGMLGYDPDEVEESEAPAESPQTPAPPSLRLTDTAVTPPDETPTHAADTLSSAQFLCINDLAQDLGLTVEALGRSLRRSFGVDDCNDLTSGQADRVIAGLGARKAALAAKTEAPAPVTP